MCRVGTLWTGSPKLSQAIFSPSSNRWWQMSVTHLTCFPRSGKTFSSVAICIPLASTNLKSGTMVRGHRRLLAEAPRLCSHPLLPPAVLWQMIVIVQAPVTTSMVEHATPNNQSVFPARGHKHLAQEKQPLTSLAVKAVFYMDRHVIFFFLPTFLFPL